MKDPFESEVPWWQQDLGYGVEEISNMALWCYCAGLTAIAVLPFAAIGFAIYLIANYEYPCPSRGCGG